MSTQLYACRVMLYHAASLVNDRKPCSVETSQAKLFICEAAKSVSLEALTIMGAYGYSKDYDLERYVRHSLLGPIVRRILGYPAQQYSQLHGTTPGSLTSAAG